MNRDLTLPRAELNAREAPSNDVAGKGCATTVLPEMRRGSVCLCLVAGASSQGGAARLTFRSVDIAKSIAFG